MRCPNAVMLAALLALTSTGCIRVDVTAGNEIAQDRVAQIVPGHTTKDDILRWFGAPADFTDGEVLARMFDAGEIAAEDLNALPFSDILVYMIADGKARGLITLVFNFMRVDVTYDRLVIYFDEYDVVKYYGITRQRMNPHETAGHKEDEEAAEAAADGADPSAEPTGEEAPQ